MSELQILTAGAVYPGIRHVVEAFQENEGVAVVLERATAPTIRERLERGESADVVIAPPRLLADFTASGVIEHEPRIAIGRVGIGIVMVPGAAAPPIRDIASLRSALATASAIVFNRASTGIYLESLFARLGLNGHQTMRFIRYPTGEAVLEHMSAADRGAIGFAAVTEIRHSEHPVAYLGSLPADIQNYTDYAASAVAGSPHPATRAFLEFLRRPQTAYLLEQHGIEAAARN